MKAIEHPLSWFYFSYQEFLNFGSACWILSFSYLFPSMSFSHLVWFIFIFQGFLATSLLTPNFHLLALVFYLPCHSYLALLYYFGLLQLFLFSSAPTQHSCTANRNSRMIFWETTFLLALNGDRRGCRFDKYFLF